jgi:hypothetical protein
MISIDVDVDLEAEIGHKVNEGVMKYLEAGADRGFAEATERAPVDRGELLRNMFTPERKMNQIQWGVRDTPYARPMEEGTAPFHPPLEPLLEWSQRVTGEKGLGYYVALHKIPTEGITAQPYIEPGVRSQVSWYDSHSAKKYIDREFR